MKIRWKISLIMAGVAVAMGCLSWMTTVTLKRVLAAEHLAKGKAVARHLAVVAAPPILIDNIVGLQELLISAIADETDVRYTFVADRRGRIVAHTFTSGLPEGVLNIALPRQGQESEHRVFLTEEGIIHDLAQPVIDASLGTLHLGLSQHNLDRKIAEVRRNLMFLTLLVMLASVAVVLILAQIVTRPLTELAAVAGEFGGGEFDHRVTVQGNDETTVLAMAFNRMADDLAAYLQQRDQAVTELQQAHDQLEERVKERTAKLEETKKSLVRLVKESNEANAMLKRTGGKLETVNKELDAFAYSVSHDLRAPLRGIDGFSQALLEDYGDRLDETGRDYLRRVRGGCVRMGELIDAMLMLSRLSRGEIKRQGVNLSALTAEVVKELREGEPERVVEVVIAPEIMVDADPQLLRAVLANLLSNAWKFTSKKETAQIKFGAEEQEGRPVYFVRDNGAGFDMQYADKLFAAFQRLHTVEEFAGTGIGLTTVQRIIHRHGGKVWAEGEEGRGATFYFTL